MEFEQTSLSGINNRLRVLEIEFEELAGKKKKKNLYLADEKLLGESWNSKEDDEAFAYLQ